MYDILIVDDTIENLKVLSTMLTAEGYKTRTSPSGSLALKSAVLKKPDLILLDINMPQMNGYEVCRKLKEDKRTENIPVIFISGLADTRDIVEGFRLGGVDYITKPFHIEEVNARVSTQLKIVHGKKELEEILSKTFLGSIQILIDILATTKPTVFEQATRVKQIVRRITKRLKLKNLWVYEIAAILSRIGWVILPDHQLEAYSGGKLNLITDAEQHDAIDFGIELIEKIPRLEPVLSILKRWYETPLREKFEVPISDWSQAEIGVNLIKLVINYVELTLVHEEQEKVFEALVSVSDQYHNTLLSALLEIEGGIKREIEMPLHIKDISIGMVLSRDIKTSDDIKLLSRESEVTNSLLMLIKRYEKQVGIKEPIYVWDFR
ncbi:response regulator [Fusibacter sp. JL216-2]|uniref:response regulator n=1 Tax=Fusibacter sp. JL216-2 TaxID=3071453 RepID=UPI003D33E124